MSELVDMHEPGDRIYTRSDRSLGGGETVRVYIVKGDGTLRLEQGDNR